MNESQQHLKGLYSLHSVQEFILGAQNFSYSQQPTNQCGHTGGNGIGVC